MRTHDTGLHRATLYRASITLDGRPEAVQPGQTIATLLRRRGIWPERIVVVLNGRLLSPSQVKATPVQSGDTLEILEAVTPGAAARGVA